MKPNRIAFLDLSRGILLCFMIFYHYSFNLDYFLDYDINLEALPFSVIPPVVSALFLFVSGFAANFSANSLKRGAYIFFWAMIITLVTFVVVPEAPITFGILHCISVSMIISYFLRNLSDRTIISLAIIVFFAASITASIRTEHSMLFFLGITGPGYSSLDYYPLIPHSSYFFLGMSAGRNKVILEKISEFKLKNKIGRLISLLGKNSLKVYLVHQPLFFLLYYFFNFLFSL